MKYLIKLSIFILLSGIIIVGYGGTCSSNGASSGSSAVDQAPILNAIGNRAVNEGIQLSFVITGTDPNGDPLVFSMVSTPTATGAILNTSTGEFSWTPGYTQAGSYSVEFVVTSTTFSDFEVITLVVTNVDRAPVLTSPGNKAVNENSLLTFTLFTSDPDGDMPSYSIDGAPSGASLISSTGVFSWTPDYIQSGSYPVTFTATTNALSDAQTITIAVTNVDRAPVLTAIGDKGVNENANLNFTLSAADPDGTAVVYTMVSTPTATGATLTAGTFDWTPSYTQAGSYSVEFTVISNGLIDSEIITIVVTNIDTAPALNAVGDKNVNEGANISFTLVGTDAEGDTMAFIMVSTPTATGATLNASTGEFSWTPTYAQAGSYSVEFVVTSTIFSDSEVITITVQDVPPPAQVTTPDPANGLTEVPINQQLGWASASGATSYDIYFGLTTTGWSPVTNTSGSGYNPGALNYNATYYWRVDSKNSAGATAGNVWQFSTVNYQPDAMIKLAVESDAVYLTDNLYETTPLTQTKTGIITETQTVSYFIKVQNDGNITDAYKITGTAGNTDWAITYYDVPTGTNITALVTGSGSNTPSLSPAESYTLRLDITPISLSIGASFDVFIRAVSNNDLSLKDTVKANIQVAAIPGSFATSTPVSGYVASTVTPILNWQSSSNATKYIVEIASEPTFGLPPVYRSSDIPSGTLSHQVPAATLDYRNTYYWRVIAINDFGQAIAANAPVEIEIFLPVCPPDSFNILTPISGSAITSNDLTFTWQDSVGETFYTLEVVTDTTYFPLDLCVYTNTAIARNTTSFTLPISALPGPGTYYWRIKARNAYGLTWPVNLYFTFSIPTPIEYSDGTLDATFGTDGLVTTTIVGGLFFWEGDHAYAATIQSDGKILVAGDTNQQTTGSTPLLARYTTTGILDTTFDMDGIVTTTVVSNYNIANMVLLTNGKIVMAGGNIKSTETECVVLQYNDDGSLDTGFGSGGVATATFGTIAFAVASMTIQSDDKILLTGYISKTGNYDFALVRFTSAGILDTGFGSGGLITTKIGSGNALATAIVLQPDGKILLTGYYWNGATSDFVLCRYNEDGSLDTTFGGGDGVVTATTGSNYAYINDMALQPDGKIVLVGAIYIEDSYVITLLCYNTDGSLDVTFGSGDGVVTTTVGSSSVAQAVALQTDGKILVAGYSNSTYDDFALLRYNTDGTLDTTFGGGDGVVTTRFTYHSGARAIIIQPDYRIILVGDTDNGPLNGYDIALARYWR